MKIFIWIGNAIRSVISIFNIIGDLFNMPPVKQWPTREEGLAAYHEVRKEILDEYTPEERAAEERRERDNYNDRMETVAFYADADTYIDYDGIERRAR